MTSAVYVSNQRSAYRVVPGALALTKTISGTAILGATDSAFTGLNKNTEVLLIQVLGGDVWVSLHGEAPAAGNALKIVDGTILEMSRSQWLASKWIRVSGDTVLTAFQLGAS
jgi:hypothetical protein